MKLTSVLFLAACVFVSVSARPCNKPHHDHKHHKTGGNTVDVNKQTYNSNKETHNTNKETHNTETNIKDNSSNNSGNKSIVQSNGNTGGSDSKGINLNLLGGNKSASTNNVSQSATIN